MAQRLVAQFADSTLLKYIPQVLHFLECVSDLELTLESPTSGHVLELLWGMHDDASAALESASAFSVIKALRWAINLLRFLFPDLYCQPFNALSFSESERKEAMPLPLFVLQYWEHCIINHAWEPHVLIFMGSALLCVWCSLRFADAQHIRWNDILIDSNTLRGLSFRTKASRSGMPFGINLQGFFALLNSAEKSWVMCWIQLLDHQWYDLRVKYTFTPDFLFAAFQGDAICGPLSYCRALKMFRHCISLVPNNPLTPSMIQNFTLHSLKCILLSWMAQLSLPAESRASQGHHVYLHSVQLYSRDDVYPSLSAQTAVRAALDNQWIPNIPIARGGQTPLSFQYQHTFSVHWPPKITSFRMFRLQSQPLDQPDAVPFKKSSIEEDESLQWFEPSRDLGFHWFQLCWRVVIHQLQKLTRIKRLSWSTPAFGISWPPSSCGHA